MNKANNKANIEIARLLLTKWIKLKTQNINKREESLSELRNAKYFSYTLSKSDSGNDILYVEFYSPTRIEYSINLNELINE